MENENIKIEEVYERVAKKKRVMEDFQIGPTIGKGLTIKFVLIFKVLMLL